MATTNRVYILISFFTSGIAVIFNLISLSTEKWITSEMKIVDSTAGSTETSYVNYGLFQGNYKRIIPTPSLYELRITCDFGQNACAFLCGDNSAFLMQQLLDNTIDPDFDYVQIYCTSTVQSYNTYQWTQVSSINVPRENFINSGVWLFTVLSIFIAVGFGLTSSILALYNTVTNPILYFLSVASLYIYNSIALGFTLIYMIVWGSFYNIRLIHNVAIFDTLAQKMNSDKMAYLNYSYWISFIPVIFYSASLAIIYYRDYLNNKDPKQRNINIDESASPNLYLY